MSLAVSRTFESGFKPLVLLSENQNSLIYRAISTRHSQPVLVKMTRQEYPSATDVRRLRREYDLCRANAFTGIPVMLERDTSGHAHHLLMEDCGGESLRRIVLQGPLNVIEFIKLALTLLQTIDHLHQRHIIHRDLNPDNILFNKDSGVALIIDFSLSTEFNPHGAVDAEDLSGSLAYIAPEQTGRINRNVDSRSDIYSLGATFYELLCGRAPFQSSDPMELIHAHIAKTPHPLNEMVPSLPTIIASIVHKMMAKAPEDRYQSARGIIHDFSRCLQLLSDGQLFPEFPLAENDQSGIFMLPQGLYGREPERECLLHAFTEAKQGKSQFVLLNGEPGVGKSALARELREHVDRAGGFFVCGKFDQYHQSVPGSAVVQALGHLVDTLLAESAEQLETHRLAILDAVGGNGALITDVLPKLELVIGPQPEPADLGPAEARLIYLRVMRSFILTFASQAHPLVFFLDDLQWSDSVSRSLIQDLLLEGKNGVFLVIGSYRTREIDALHPVRFMVKDLTEQGVSIHHIALGDLSKDELLRYVGDTVHRHDSLAHELADIIHVKTNGNPFFVGQFLQSLHAAGQIRFKDGLWEWQAEQIRKMEISNNVVDLMSDKIERMSAICRKVLSYGACFGGWFSVADLRLVESDPEEELHDAVHTAMTAGLLIPARGQAVQFVHDRVREAAYRLLGSQRREEIHYQIARRTLETETEIDLERKLFYLVGHMNSGARFVSNGAEAELAARLNLRAARKARASTHYDAALNFANYGMKFLGEQNHDAPSDLRFPLLLLQAECTFMLGDHIEADRIFQQSLAAGRTNEARAQVYLLWLRLKQISGDYDSSIAFGLEGLKQLDMKLTANPSMINLLIGLMIVRFKLRRLGPTGFANLPKLDSDREELLNALLFGVAAPAYFVNKKLYLATVVHITSRGVRRGVDHVSSPAFVYFAVIMAMRFKAYREATWIGAAAIQMAERFKNETHKGSGLFAYGGFLLNWLKPIEESVRTLEEAFLLLIKAGNNMMANFAALYLCYYPFYGRRPIEACLEEQKKYLDFIRKTKDRMVLDCALPSKMFMEMLARETPLDGSFQGDDEDEASYVARIHAYKTTNPVGWYNVHKLWGLYLSGRHEEALQHLPGSETYTKNTPFGFGVLIHHTNRALLFAALFRKAEQTARRRYLRGMRRSLARLRLWAQVNPASARAPYLLVLAEYERVSNHGTTAERYYEGAVEAARENGQLALEALANELAARAYFTDGRDRIALAFLKEASCAYEKWGAKAKVRQLDNEFPQLGWAMTSARGESKETNPGKTFDYISVVKSTQALAKEIEMDRLVGQLLTIMIENAGAERGLLIVEDSGQAIVHAERRAGDDAQTTLINVAVANSDLACESVVSYVQRVHDDIVIADLGKDDRFSRDPYVSKHAPKSVLCFPILLSGKLKGIVYLENNKSLAVFTASRVEILRLLSSQAAISLENARLYENMGAKARMESELRTARTVQETLFPPATANLPPVQIAGHYSPASECGGDWWFYNNLEDRILLWIGDATGHGAPAALITSAARSAASILSRQPAAPLSSMIADLNRAIAEISSGRMNMTLIIGSVDKATGLFTYCNASHEPAFVIRHAALQQFVKSVDLAGSLSLSLLSQVMVPLLDGWGPRLGETIHHTFETASTQLQPGDLLVFYTDGVRDLVNPMGAEWGERQMLRAILRAIIADPNFTSVVPSIVAQLEEYRDGADLVDDVTFFIVRYAPIS